jgi:hypothetical protein
MSGRYYRLPSAVAAILSLLLGGCGWIHKSDPATATNPPVSAEQQASAEPSDGMDTEATIWTILGLADKPSKLRAARLTGDEVSPILWQAVHDTLNFATIESQDPKTGLLVTDWYSPKDKPNERLRITAFIKSRALRSDSIAVSIERQVRAPTGQWQDSTVAKEVVTDLENDILQRARQIHAANLRQQ